MGRLFNSATMRRGGVGFDGVFKIADLGGAGGGDEVLRGDGVDDVSRGRQSFGLEGLNV